MEGLHVCVWKDKDIYIYIIYIEGLFTAEDCLDLRLYTTSILHVVILAVYKSKIACVTYKRCSRYSVKISLLKCFL